MVTGGFKVWHIIFIIIAFLITLVVIYCCFHRCRIPRTKQEIEADSWRSSLTKKFRNYLQELPTESINFLEAIKKVQELEEKMEQDDAKMSRDLGARKRMGWLKLKGKDGKEVNEVKDDNSNKDTSEEPKLNGLTSADTSALREQVGTKEIIPVEPVTQLNQVPAQTPAAAAVVVEQSVEPEKVPMKETDQTKDESSDKRLDSNNKDQDVKETQRHPRRRRHKPNLARTKRAREKSHGEIELDRPPVEASPDDLATAQVFNTQPPNTVSHHRHHRSRGVESKPLT